MKFTKKDYLDLLKLADIIEKKEFFNKKTPDGYLQETLPEDKRDGNQFNLGEWFFNCGRQKVFLTCWNRLASTFKCT